MEQEELVEKYFSCCGISYEYLDDISVRKALQIIYDSIDKERNSHILNKILEIDHKLQDLIFRNEDNSSITFEGEWWKKNLPINIRP